jgi:hypothetical protein
MGSFPAPTPVTAYGAAHGGRLGLDGRVVPLTAGQSIPGVANTIEAQAGQGGLRYLNYRARSSAG